MNNTPLTFTHQQEPNSRLIWVYPSFGDTLELLVHEGAVVRIAIATMPPTKIGQACRPYGLETYIEKVIGLPVKC